MDAMALLCNMHADGPATIKLLRRAGFASLSDITRARHERLADLLGVSPAYARRFVREARLLGNRMGENVFDVEESAELDAGEAPLAAASSPSPVDESASRFELSEVPAETRLGVPHAPSPETARFRIHAALFATQPGNDAEMRGPARADTPATSANPARVLPAQGTALRRGLIEGLDASWCDRLVAQGILTLETLVDAPGMKLAKRLGVPLTDLMDLQVLAGRELALQADTKTPAGEQGGTRALDRSTDRAGDSPPSTFDYVIYPPRRAREERREELETRDDAALITGDRDAEELAALHLSQRDPPEDVGGPFA